MEQVKLIKIPVTDEFGGTFEKAQVVVWGGSGNTQISFASKDGAGNYVFSNDGFAVITYRLSFWYSEDKRLAGVRSRPLIRVIDGVDTSVFTVDLDAPELADLLASNVDVEDKILQVIVSDAIRQLS
tara:strand:- start:798 stop:1178 length:381 start_codon:yes stop_codon:yes gene_type:complete